jgi:hypothetical protein
VNGDPVNHTDRHGLNADADHSEEACENEEEECFEPDPNDEGGGTSVTSTFQPMCASGYQPDDHGGCDLTMGTLSQALGMTYNLTSGLTEISRWTQALGVSVVFGTGVGAVLTYLPTATTALAIGTAGATTAGVAASGDVTFTHFTDGAGLQGITGLDPGVLSPGQSTTVNTLQFGVGQNSYLANNPGDIFVTSLPPTASPLQLSLIGVYGPQQGFAISFSGAGAAAQGVLVQGSGGTIYTIPANSTLTGCFSVLCRP